MNVCVKRGNDKIKHKNLTIFILEHLIIDGWCHTNGLAREVRVEIKALPHRHTSWRVTVTGQERKHVILPSMPEREREKEFITIRS